VRRQYHGLIKPDGTLLYANREALGLIDARLDDVVGKRLWENEWFKEPTGASDVIRDLVERVRDGGEPQSIEITLKMPKGIHHFDYTVRPIKDANGDVVSLIPECYDTPQALTGREKEVLYWTAVGKTASETGIILGISRRTVEWYAQSARRKINATNIVQAIAMSIKAGVI
jgi:DNA-binding CsgD family transcriptional regulator